MNPLDGCGFLASVLSKQKVITVSEQEQVLQEWHIIFLNATHNHNPSPVEDQARRQIDKETFMSLLVDPLIREGCLTRSILETLHTNGVPGGANIEFKHIKTRRAKLRRQQQGRERQKEAIDALILKQKILEELKKISKPSRKRQRLNQTLLS